jgi:hypothetical protein
MNTAHEAAGRPGGQPIEVWIDGKHYPDITTARMEFQALTGRKRRDFTQALYTTGDYRGHRVSLSPPRRHETPKPKRPEGILLWGHCVHRLGTY